jgi:hypothetical protein
VLGAFKTYLQSGGKKIMKEEKAAIGKVLPNLVAKLTAVGPGDWSLMRQAASK